MKEEKKTNVTWILWGVIIVLLLALVYQNNKPVTEAVGPELGKPGTKFFNQEPQKKEKEKLGRIGVSIPASLNVKDYKALISIKNTGEQAIVPYTLVGKKEVYRSSRVLEPGESLSAVIPVGNADKCVTYVETLNGEKFSVTSKLIR